MWSFPIYSLHLSALKCVSTQSLMEKVLLGIFLAQKWKQGSADTGYLTAGLLSGSQFQIWVALACCQIRFVPCHLHSSFFHAGAGWYVMAAAAAASGSWHLCSVLRIGVLQPVSIACCSLGNILPSCKHVRLWDVARDSLFSDVEFAFYRNYTSVLLLHHRTATSH